MMTLAIGIVALLLALWGLDRLAKLDARTLVARLSQIGGGVALAAGVLLAVTGRFVVAVPLLFLGLSLLGWLPNRPAGWSQRTQRSTGQSSRARTALLDMELDHDSGEMRGTVTAGAHQGRTLDDLTLAELGDLYADADGDSRALLEAYLDRRAPGWREHGEADAAAGRGEGGRDGAMTQQEAYEILGLEPGAAAEDIRRAHRTLMKRLHPDQGGTDWLASRVNEAKDVLLRHHR
ncbi:DnaJ domain-containing protein [Blastochloris sulfoviridis]|uniref:DnaJ domain-containing protein n=1 Tax=Blastochloris sulfoviridis TaxID=50712 RepID=A0A5M6I2E7_9HYPH|nr:DnaJ domain-containing protein [Blastochloris sulfoviridis]KAA5601995.1 DnaJ domain-containing protein [Blastochloris sulfoviridis]